MPVRLRSHWTIRRKLVLVIGTVVLLRAVWQLGTLAEQSSATPPIEGEYQLLNITENGRLVVRPIDALPGSPPLTVAMLAVATLREPHASLPLQQYLQRQLDAATVRLRFDRRRDGADGTTLAWVFRGDQLINAEVVREGLLRADTHSSDSASLRKQVIVAEKEARQANRGVWIGIQP